MRDCLSAGIALGIAIGFILNMTLTGLLGHQWNNEITQHKQCARFNSVTGSFEWLDKKDKK